MFPSLYCNLFGANKPLNGITLPYLKKCLKCYQTVVAKPVHQIP